MEMGGPVRNLVSLVLAALLVLAAAGAARALRVGAMDHFLATQRYEDVYYLPPAHWLPVLSLGHDEALADLLWMRALIYFGDELGHQGLVRHVFDYADAILALDPDFRKAYRWVGMAGMYHAGEITVDDLRRSVSYLERGARRFPDDGEMAWDCGASLAFELAPRVTDEAEKRELRARGVEHMQTAARLGAGPDWLVLTNATQLRRLGRTEQAIRHLEEMYATVRDPDTKAEIGRQLVAARGEAWTRAFEQAQRELEERRSADYPYMSTTLYLLVGPRRLVTGDPLRPEEPDLNALVGESETPLPEETDPPD